MLHRFLSTTLPRFGLTPITVHFRCSLFSTLRTVTSELDPFSFDSKREVFGLLATGAFSGCVEGVG